jgi:hypothetical protein
MDKLNQPSAARAYIKDFECVIRGFEHFIQIEQRKITDGNIGGGGRGSCRSPMFGLAKD